MIFFSIGHSLSVLSRTQNNQTVLRIKKLGTELPVEQSNVNIQGLFTLYNTAIPQTLRRVQISDTGDFADLRDNGELVISLGTGKVFKEFDLTTESCQNAIELYEPTGLSPSIVLLITCRDGRVLCAKYSNDEYSIDSIFVSEYTSSTPVIVTNNGVSTAIYTVVVEGISALAIRSLEPNGYEQFMYVETFEDTFGSCMETLSYNETHVRLSCSNTHDFYLVDGTGETDGRRICPQGMDDLVNIYNEDIVLVVSSSFVTINTKESTNFCNLNLPTPVIIVDYVRINDKLLLLFFSYDHLYEYDTSKPCLDKNLVILVNKSLVGLNGDYQNYLIFGDLLVYTVMDNGLFSSRGIDLSTSQDIGILANHQNHPLLYGIIYENSKIPISTATLSVAATSTVKTIESTTMMSSSDVAVVSPVADVSESKSQTPILVIIVPFIIVIGIGVFMIVGGFLFYIFFYRKCKDSNDVKVTDSTYSITLQNYCDESSRNASKALDDTGEELEKPTEEQNIGLSGDPSSFLRAVRNGQVDLPQTKRSTFN